MRTWKSLCLGGAASLVAVTAGQAAEPVQYVKICSLYGAGFSYMPGTDMCIKIGGWVRAEAVGGANGNLDMAAPFNGNINNRATNNITTRERGYITADAREQTAYGTARGYLSVGINSNNIGSEAPSGQFSANRAFIQWAGMTAGLAESFYDFYSAPLMQYRTSYLPTSDTSDTGWWVWAYTAQFGGGFSATLSAEERRTTQIINANCVGSTPCGFLDPGLPGTGAYGGWQVPDIVFTPMRIDQAWGGAQIMGALHEVNSTYYSPAVGGTPIVTAGHPGDTWGWAAGAGLKVNLPSIAPGDSFAAQVNFAAGATKYLFNTPDVNWGKVNGASEAFGVQSDCVYGGALGAGPTSCQLTTAWGFNAGFEHYWTPEWHQSLYGAYYAVRYDTTANAMLCAAAGGGNGIGLGTGAMATPGCNNNWSTWGIGSRLQWDVTKSFYLGTEVLYQNLDSAKTFNGSVAGTGYAIDSATAAEGNSNNLVLTVRAHKDFLP